MITRREEGLWIEWEEHAHQSMYPARALRQGCPCASCVDEMSGRPLLDPESVPADIAPAAVRLVGTYGIRVDWSDGHNTGIYTFERLRAGCRCPGCRA